MVNVFGVGEMPRKFDGASVVERAAACAVRVKGRVIAPESQKVRNISGSARRLPRGTSVFFASDPRYVGEELLLAATFTGYVCHRAPWEVATRRGGYQRR